MEKKKNIQNKSASKAAPESAKSADRRSRASRNREASRSNAQTTSPQKGSAQGRNPRNNNAKGSSAPRRPAQPQNGSKRPAPPQGANKQVVPKKQQQKRASGAGKKVGIVFGVIVALLAAIYIIGIFYFQSHFFPNTTFDGVSLGGKTIDTAQSSIETALDSYSLLITDLEGNTYSITGSDFDLKAPEDGQLSDLLSSQNTLLWIASVSTQVGIDQDFTGAYDETKLNEAVAALSMFDEENITHPQDAQIVFSATENGYIIEPEVIGNAPVLSSVLEKIKTAVNTLSLSVSLDENDYEKPAVTSDDETLKSELEKVNAYLNTTITYEIGDTSEVLDSSTIRSWIEIDDEHNITIDEAEVYEYVQTLASKYNTYGDVRSFQTTLGDTISVGGGDYGWVIDKQGETEQIIADIESSETDISREPVYSQTALTHSSNDLGDTYLELDYTNQHFYFYKNGTLVLDDDIVSGTIYNGNGSPDGFFKIVYKEKDAQLVGEDYDTTVDYFMPFAYNVGFHDASWQTSLGGQKYLTSGSHGCINLWPETAEKLYNLLEVGTPVVGYYRDPVKLTSESAEISNAYSYDDGTASTTTDTTTTTTEEVTIPDENSNLYINE